VADRSFIFALLCLVVVLKASKAEYFKTTLKQLEQEVELKAVYASGHGGQNINKNATAVQLYHPASGIRLKVMDERAQYQNKKIALKRLQEKLKELNKKLKIKKEQLKRKQRKKVIPRREKEKRLKDKKIRSQKKEFRRRVKQEE